MQTFGQYPLSLDVPRLLQEAMVLSNLGRYAEALARYQEILSVQPDNLDALNNHGVTLMLLLREREALASFDRALRIKPDFVEVLNNRGTSLARLRMFSDALESLDRALVIRPDYVDALRNRGTALRGLGRNEDAVRSYDRALAIDPRQIDVLSDRGKVLVKLGRHEDALASFESVLAIKPGFLDALNDRGIVLLALRRFQEALANFDQALAIRPDFVDALNNRGYALERLTQYDDALASYDRALAIKPDYAEVLDNRGIVLAKLGRFDEALESEDAAQKIQPDYAKAHLHEAFTRLCMGDLRLGLRKYEWRWLDDEQKFSRREFSQPLWLGMGKLRGKTILLHAEQGLGDLIQFVRYAPLAAAKGATVLLEVPEALAPLMTGLAGVSRILIWGEPLPLTDFHCPLLSLPLAFGTTLETIPISVPYLSANPETVAAWRARLPQGGEKLIGVCWKGSSNYKGDHERSIQFADFAPLLSVPGIRFVSLQKELTEEERRLADALPIVHPGADFKSTAEMIAALDLVISVDTAWAHWAGAIGKPLWVLLPFSAHWVWFTGREDSPWYPTARLFRQSKIGDWKGVIRNVKKELAKKLDTV